MIEKLERFIDRLTGVFVGVCVLGLFGLMLLVLIAFIIGIIRFILR
jgi:hypothetical protein